MKISGRHTQSLSGWYYNLAAIQNFQGKRSDVHFQDLTDIDFSLIPRPTII